MNIQGKVILEKNYKKESKREIVEQLYKQYFQKLINIDDHYPMIQLMDHFNFYLCTNDIIFVAVCSKDCEIIQIFYHLYSLIDVIKDVYNQNINQQVISDNYANILVMLDHYYDYNNVLVFHKQVLQEMIKPKNNLNSLIRQDNYASFVKFVDSLNDVQQNNRSIWQIKDVQDTNHIFFDVIEYIDCIMDKNGRFINQEINGEIKVKNQLSSTPEINCWIKKPVNFFDYSVHECLLDNIDLLESQRLLNFQPQNGNFNLLYYKQISINNKASRTITSNYRSRSSTISISSPTQQQIWRLRQNQEM